MITKYGMISDVHKHPEKVLNAIEELKGEGVDAFILNGDVGDAFVDMEKKELNYEAMQQNTARIIKAVASVGAPTFVQPGSHETVLGYLPVVEWAKKNFPNVTNLLEHKFQENEDHDLVFLPGDISDFTAGGEFIIGNGLPTGLYLLLNEGNGVQPYKVNGLNDLVEQVQKFPGRIKRQVYFQNVQDLQFMVERPERTIAICHVPARSNAGESGIDHAVFEVLENGVRPATIAKQELEKKHGKLTDVDFYLLAAKEGINIKRENVGNEGLKAIYDSLGITKQISGHIHESGHNAHDTKDNPVRQMEYTTDLQWNSGCIDEGQTGVLFVDGDKVAYKNLRI